jgi:hypothetical protein
MLPLPHGGERVLIQRTVYDRFNDPTYTDHHYIDGCLVAIGSNYTGRTNSNTSATDQLTTDATLYAPPGSDILYTDRVIRVPAGMTTVPPGTDPQGKIIRRDNAFAVDSLPQDWLNPFSGWQPGMEVRMRRVI